MAQTGPVHKRCEDGEVLFFQGEPDTRLYRLEGGTVLLYMMFQKPRIIAVLNQSQFFGFAPICSGYHLYNAEAVGTARVEIFEYNPQDQEFLNSHYTGMFHDLKQFSREKLRGMPETEERELWQLISALPLRTGLRSFEETFLIRFFPFQTVTNALKKWVSEGKIASDHQKGSYRLVEKS